MGDVVANLRGALDHLVWFLAGEKAHRHTAFVIEGNEDDYLFKVTTQRALAGLSDGAVDFIRECQPFHRTPPDPRVPEQHALVVRRWALETLHRLNNIGKHQELHLFVHGWLAASLPEHDGVSWDERRPTQHIEEGTLVARARGDVPADVEPVIDFEIQVRDQPTPVAATYFLGDAAAAVLQVHRVLGCA